MNISLVDGWYRINARVTTRMLMLSTLDNKNPFEQLHGKMSVEKNAEQFKGLSGSTYRLLLVLGIIGLAGTLIVSMLSLALSKNSSNRAEVKRKLLFKSAVAVVLFAFPFFVGIYHTIIYKISLN